MDISPDDLRTQVLRARATWPFIDGIGAAHGLPTGLLLAVGSRETNLTDEVGDGGHGHGVWQLDDRSHRIPDPYPVMQQAEDAAVHLASGMLQYGSWVSACNAYNSGSPNVASTTGGNYGPECIARAAWIAVNLPLNPSPLEDNMPITAVDTRTGFVHVVDETGAVFDFTHLGAPGGFRLGALNTHPDWQAGGSNVNGPVVAAWCVDDAATPATGRQGLIILTRDAAGTFHAYDLTSDGRYAP
jgi:hypothetical protein